MIVIALIIVVLTLIGLKIRATFSYFRTHGIAEDPGYFPFGSKASWKMLLTKISFLQMTDQIYAEFPDEKIVGTYGPLGKRTIVIRHMEIAKRVLIKDFDHFVDRRHLIANRKANKYFMDMLTTMNGDKWKEMRTIISPVFTSGKLKTMMPIIHRVSFFF
jgi:cytochrome P450